MRIILFSDVHADIDACRLVVAWSKRADVVVVAGNLATRNNERLGETVDALADVRVPLLLVPGTTETTAALARAAQDLPNAYVLHGSAVPIGRFRFFGLGGVIGDHPADGGERLTEDEAAHMLAACPRNAVVVTHTPPHGHLDAGGLGSRAVLEALRRTDPELVICGGTIDPGEEVGSLKHADDSSTILKPGPGGMLADLDAGYLQALAPSDPATGLLRA
jgi:Icc-related predicted phosphoesterase